MPIRTALIPGWFWKYVHILWAIASFRVFLLASYANTLKTFPMSPKSVELKILVESFAIMINHQFPQLPHTALFIIYNRRIFKVLNVDGGERLALRRQPAFAVEPVRLVNLKVSP